MVNTFSLLLGIFAVFVVVGAITKTMLTPPKVWDPDDWAPEELEENNDYDEMRKENPHIWIN